ncbi:MAG: AtpZ/AtpI family protein [Anaerolineae bacterium]|nr:AtpZ/AtpI family protein [Anaerolineae bacterium]
MKTFHETDTPSHDDTVEEPPVSTFPRLLAEATTLAWNLAFPIVGGVLLGRYLDDRLGQDYTWTLSLLVLGVLVAFSNLYTLYVEHGPGKESRKREPKQKGKM